MAKMGGCSTSWNIHRMGKPDVWWSKPWISCNFSLKPIHWKQGPSPRLVDIQNLKLVLETLEPSRRHPFRQTNGGFSVAGLGGWKKNGWTTLHLVPRCWKQCGLSGFSWIFAGDAASMCLYILSVALKVVLMHLPLLIRFFKHASWMFPERNI